MASFISIVVVIHNIPEQGYRTLRSLSSEYQDVAADRYEVVVIDNGSTPPFGKDRVKSIGPNFRYQYMRYPKPSPVFALNHGAKLAKGDILGFIVDGARMVSPGLLRYAFRIAAAYDKPIIATMPFHLGPKIQRLAVAEGYTSEIEERALEEIDWFHHGYRLFEISAFGGSADQGWFRPIAESGCLFLTRESFFDQLQGYDENFDLPGGGLASLDFFRRACELQRAQLIIILGEGTFHQLHPGAFTGASKADAPFIFEDLAKQYRKIRGREYRKPELRPDFIGHVHDSLFPSLKFSLPPTGQYEAARTVIILGMQRSGTGTLAGSLQEAGLYFGDVATASNFNLKGNGENHAVMFLQEELLKTNNGSWDNPPARVEWGKTHRAVRDLFISSFAGHALWGFKDPRTLFTLEGWTAVLPNVSPVGIFRHPALAAALLEKHDGVTYSRGLELWKVYNKKLLSLYGDYRFPIIEFDPESFPNKLKKLCRMLDLPNADINLSFEERPKSSQPLFLSLPDDIIELYTRLQGVKI